MTGTTETIDPQNHVEEVEHQPEDQTNEGPETQDFPPLFDDESEALTENQLTGEEESPESEEEAVSPPPEGEETKQADEDEQKVEAEEEEKADGDAQEDDKPPQGFVPLAALHEERGKRQYLSQEVETLKTEIQTLKQSPQPLKTDSDFKVLSDEEFQELRGDDPEEAIAYLGRLRAYDIDQARKADIANREQAIIERSTQAMRDAIPEIYNAGSTINEDLSKFAVEQGFSEEYLPIMTDPRTKVIPPGSDEPVLLGDVAVGQVKMLHNLFQQRANNTGRAAIEKEVTARVTKEVTDKVTKQIMTKFKATPPEEYRSLGDIPGGEEHFDVTKNRTAKEVDRMSEAQRRVYLGG